jgi:hypothetical protein
MDEHDRLALALRHVSDLYAVRVERSVGGVERTAGETAGGGHRGNTSKDHRRGVPGKVGCANRTTAQTTDRFELGNGILERLSENDGFGSNTAFASGRCGIRTHGTLADTTVFKTVALNHSANLPGTL